MKTKTVYWKKWIVIAFLAICCFFSAIGGFLAKAAADSTTGMTFGTEYMYVARKTSTEPLRTFEATVNVTNPSNNYGGVILGNYRTNGSVGFRFEIGENGATIDNGYPNLYIKDAANVVHNFAFTEAGVFGIGKAHIAIVLDDDAAKCYINGELQQFINYEGETPFIPVVTAGNSMQLGSDGDAWRRFRGEIYDAAIYTDVRTATEIATDAVEPKGDNLLLAYEVSSADSSAASIADKSGNGFDLAKQAEWIDPANKTALSDYDYSFAIVGDPQIMNAQYPDAFNGIFSWINDNAESKKINQVMVMGDLVDSNGAATEEWQRGQAALNGLTVPYNLVRGNHDGYLSEQSTATFDTYFGGSTKYAQSVTGYYTAGGTYANAYRTFEVCGVPYLVIMLDYGPSDAVLEWANGVIAANPKHNVIVMTHSYLSTKGTTQNPGDSNPPSSVTYGNDGTEIWNNLVRKHENIVMVLSGHEGADQVVMTQRQGDNGNTVTEFLIDPQELDARTDGGTGMVTMMYFSNNGRTVQLETYSTVKNQYFMTTNQFSFELDASTLNTPEMLYGAYVRCDTISGIRFSAYVTEEIANAEGYTYGFFLAENSTEKTWSIDEMTAEKQAEENSGIAKLVSKTWALANDKYNKDGYKLYHAVITGLPTDVYGTEFVARAFVQDAAGNYYYSDTISTRSIAYVANMALNDTDYIVTLDDTQKSILQDYVDEVVSGSLALNTNTLTFAEIGDVQKLATDAEMVSYTSNNESIVTVDEDGTVRAIGEGSTTITAVMGSQVQTVNVTVNGSTGKKVTKYIRTVDDFYSIMNATSGYYVLENDLYLGTYKPGDVVYDEGYTSAYQFHPSVSFGGTLDGNGYTIHYSHVSQHSVYLFQTLTNTAIVKNLNVNVSYYNNTSVAYVRAAALAYENKGAIENVYVNALVPTPAQSHGNSTYEKFAKAGLVIVNNGTINNTVVMMTYTGEEIEHLNGICATDNGTITNTAFIRNHTGIKLVNSGSTDGNVKIYDSVADFANGFDNFVSSGYTGTNYPIMNVTLSDVGYEYFADNAIDLTINDISGTVASVKLGGEEISYAVDGGDVTIPASVMEGKNGKNEVVITTNTGIYTVTVNVLKKVLITDADGFKAIANDTAGYYVLGNDINLGTFAANKTVAATFSGTLDGNGYTVSYVSSGHYVQLFGTIAAGGTVKNMNLIVDTTAHSGNPAANYALAKVNRGTIENVYSQVTFKNNANAVASLDYSSSGLVGVNYGTINNTIVELIYKGTAANFTGWHGVAYDNAGTVTNSAVISDLSIKAVYKENGTISNAQTYTSVESFVSGFDNFVSSGYTGTNYPTITYIGTAAEFKAIPSGSTEYYILTTDINLGEYNLGNNMTFAGVLDGNGYSLTYSYGASHDRVLFNTISGTVKNLTVNVTFYNGNQVRVAALAQTNSGTRENVYVNVTANQPGQADNNVTYGKAGVVMTNNGKINNSVVLVHYTGTVALGSKLLAVAVKNNGTVTNTAVITVIDNASAGTMSAGVTGTNVVIYTSIEAFAEDLTNFKAAGYTGTNYPIPTIALSDMEYAYFVGEATDLTVDDIFGTVASVKLGEEEVSYVVDGGGVAIAGDVMASLASGAYYFTVTTDASIYTVTVNVLKKILIKTVEDFVAIENDMAGYYVLANDLSIYSGGGNSSNYRFNKPLGFVEANKNPGTNVPFTGTLDGNGHTLTYNYSWRSGTTNHDLSLFYIIGETGVIKNLGLNVTEGVGAATARTAALAWINNGTIENVYAKISFSHNASGQNEAYGAAGLVVSNRGVINNCIVDYTMSLTSGTMPAAVVAVNNAGATISNTAAIVTCGATVNYQNTNSGTKSNTPTYTSLATFAVDLENFKAAGYTGTLMPDISKIHIIKTVEDFVAIENDMAGYYILANDLSIYSGGGNSSNYRFNKPLGFVEANKNPGTNVPFTGTLDGNGHTLTYNYSWRSGTTNHDLSLFYIIGETGVIKNLGLNVTEGVGAATARTAALAWINNGTIENVYAKISFSHNASGQNEAYGAAGLVVSNRGVINNCIVDYTMSLTSGTMPAAVVAVNNAGATISNTAAIVTCGATVNYQNTNSGTKSNTLIYTAHSAFYAEKDSFISGGFVAGEFWTIGESGVTFGR